MTLIVGMSKDDGIYLSTDYRVSDWKTKKLIDDATVKFLGITYPDDVVAMLCYSGLATLKDGTPMGVWLRETLRGQNDRIQQSMQHLRTRVDRDFGPLKIPLVITIVGRGQGKRFIGGLSNDYGTEGIKTKFRTMWKEPTQPILFADGSGTPHVRKKHSSLLLRQLRVKPRRALEHMKLLATINRRVAKDDATVSPFCNVAFLPSAPGAIKSRTFTEKGEFAPFAMPTLLFGNDLTDTLARVSEQFAAQQRRESVRLDLIEAAINAGQIRRK